MRSASKPAGEEQVDSSNPRATRRDRRASALCGCIVCLIGTTPPPRWMTSLGNRVTPGCYRKRRLRDQTIRPQRSGTVLPDDQRAVRPRSTMRCQRAGGSGRAHRRPRRPTPVCECNVVGRSEASASEWVLAPRDARTHSDARDRRRDLVAATPGGWSTTNRWPPIGWWPTCRRVDSTACVSATSTRRRSRFTRSHPSASTTRGSLRHRARWQAAATV